MMRSMSDLTAIVHRYIDSWNETDADRRRALIAEVFTPDASYTDPLIAAKRRVRALFALSIPLLSPFPTPTPFLLGFSKR